MGVLSELEPLAIWKWFEEICKVPRPSKKEGQMIQFLESFAKEYQLDFKKDAVGNVLITKQASKGREGGVTVVLQSHLDMVGEKHGNVVHDFEKDPIIPMIKEGWVKASGTTLGADDGIGIAAQLALLASNEIVHGPLECLFTIDEETGLSGAFALKEGFFSGKTLLNLDSEDEGELFIGCAGGIDTVANLNYQKDPAPDGYVAINISVTGLTGGHSGDDIEKGLGNANKILNRFLWEAFKNYDLRLALIDGGNLRNAIAREASAVVLVPGSKKESLRIDFNVFSAEVQNELAVVDRGVKLVLGSTDLPEFVVDGNSTNTLLNVLYACPHGVIEMSAEMEGLVQTSTNLASVKMRDEAFVITTSQRSSIESARDNVANMVESVFLLAGAEVKHSDGYPGWAPNPSSAILKNTVAAYKALFNTEPKVRAIHAGLECGLFLEKYPGMDMVSFGPTIKGAHSPEERLEIASVEKFWLLMLEVLKRVDPH